MTRAAVRLGIGTLDNAATSPAGPVGRQPSLPAWWNEEGDEGMNQEMGM